MKRHSGFALAVLSLFLCMSSVPFALAADNPHVSMDACPACHVDIPTPEDAFAQEFRLARGSVDDTCRTCHADTACALGLGRVVHPSGIDEWDRRICDGPKTLPLFEGRISCTTCHYYLKPVGNDFRMVRNVKFYDGQPELSGLCADCHEDYY
jgi:hypothetical protein